jgi:hypothetical protein
MQLIQEITFSYGRVQLFDSRLIRLEFFGNITVGKKEAKETNDAIGLLSKGRESLVLIVADEITSFSKEALDFSSSEEGMRYTSGDALVVKSLSQRVTANFYLKINKPKKPSKIFNSEKDAVNWLFALESSFVPA